jgi:hypothetical protein
MKKFTCTDKWDNNWHFALSPFHKLAWSFVNDRCDHAGVIEVPDVLMAGYVGDPTFTMEAFAIIAGPERIVRLASGAWWLPKYVGFQHAGGVSAKKKPHQPAVRSIIKNRLPILIGNDSDGVYAVHNQWVKDSSLYPIPYPTDRDVLRKTYVNDSYRDRDKEKDKEKETDQGLHADGFLDFALELPPCCALNIEPTTDEIDAARRHDPVAPLVKQTGLTRDQMTAYIATLNSGAEKFTPESLLLAYANELTQREYRVYRGGVGQRTAPFVTMGSFRTDCERFVDLARKRPEMNKLVLREAAASSHIDLRTPPAFNWRKAAGILNGTGVETAAVWSSLPESRRRIIATKGADALAHPEKYAKAARA